MNKKSIDKIETYTLDFSYSNFIKEIFQIKSIDKFIDYINNDVNNIDELQGKLGVFWHTQGSGKSYSIIFICQKIVDSTSSLFA